MPLTIRAKLASVLVIILLLFALQLLITYFALERLLDTTRVNARNYAELGKVLDFVTITADAPSSLRHYLLVGGSPRDHEASFMAAVRSRRRAIARVARLPGISSAERRILRDIDGHLVGMRTDGRRILETAHVGDGRTTLRALVQLGEHVEDINILARRFRERDLRTIGRQVASARRAHATLENVLLGLLALTGAAAAFGVWVTSRITRPIKHLVEGVRHISDGNLEHRLQIATGDEIEELAEAFNGMVDNLHHEARTAAEIQRRLLPPKRVHLPGVRIHARQVQAKLVGGDWYDYYQLGDDICLLIADASGKGMPGALLATVAMSTIRSEPRFASTVETLLKRTNEAVESQLGGGDFVTLFSAQLALDGHVLKMVNCGHESPLFFDSRSGRWELYRCDSGLPLGISRDLFKPKTLRKQLKPGDKLVLYTDGLHDVRNDHGEFLSMELILRLLDEKGDGSIETIVDRLLDSAVEFGGGHLADDITLLGLEIAPKKS